MADDTYQETDQKLQIRIRAHTEFTNLSLESLIQEALADCQGMRLLELGCGSGNFFTLFGALLGPSGRLIGLDKDLDLLAHAQRSGRGLKLPCTVLPWDFDRHPYPFGDATFDVLIAPFSAYYSQDVQAWIEDGLRVLRPGGRLLLLGPTPNNAQELQDLNDLAYGVRSLPETDATARKLQDEFLPELRGRQDVQVRVQVVDRRIEFPSAEEMARYYMATWLFERTQVQTAKRLSFEEVVAASAQTNLQIGKQVVIIDAIRSL